MTEKEIKKIEWMKEKNIRDYIEVWKVINQYSRYPTDILKKAKEEIIK